MSASGSESREKARVAGLIALLTLAPFMVVFAHRGVAPLVIALALVAATRGDLWAEVFRKARRPALSEPFYLAAVAFLAFLLWGAITSAWSPAQGGALLATHPATPALAAVALAFAVLRLGDRAAKLMSGVFAAWVCVAVLLLCFEAASGGWLRSIVPPTDLSLFRHKDMIALARGLTAAIPSVFAASAILTLLMSRQVGRRFGIAAAIALYALSMAAALGLEIQANVAALAAGGLCALVAFVAPKATLRALMFGFIALLLASPLFALLPAETAMAALVDTLPASWLYRLAAWQATAAAALDCLPFGCGVGATRALAESSAMIMVPGVGMALPAIPVHPHSVFLQIWLEFGAPGVMLVGIAAICATRALVRAGMSRSAAVAAAGAIAAFLLSAAVEASLTQVWRLAALALAALGVALVARISQDVARP